MMMIMENKRVVGEGDVAFLKVLFHSLLGETEESYENFIHDSGQKLNSGPPKYEAILWHVTVTFIQNKTYGWNLTLSWWEP